MYYMRIICIHIVWFTWWLFVGQGCLFGQQSLLQSGPMVGYSSMREVPVWVQLKAPALVKIAYWPKDSLRNISFSREIHLNYEDQLIGVLTADRVEPGTKYHYALYINGHRLEFPHELSFQTQSLWQWRTNPPDFTFAAGSCFYVNEDQFDRPGKPYGGEYEIMLNIHTAAPDFMVWLGDNTYLRETDWDSPTGYYKRYTHTRSLKELQPLLANTHQYATWDDHDYGPNDSDRTWRLKQVAKDHFDRFWLNPPFSAIPQGGVTNMFQWADCDFFLLDDRWYKSPNSMPGTVLGREQIDWLKGVLLESKAPFKFVCLGVMFLSTAANKENMVRAAPDEREELIRFIQDNEIEGVIFLTGDRHFAEFSALKEHHKVPIYDFTTSPLTAGFSSRYLDEKNELMERDSRISKRNFGLIKVTGPEKSRQVQLFVMDSQGKQLKEYALTVNDFKVKK
jgi:alkaline phosphatase D